MNSRLIFVFVAVLIIVVVTGVTLFLKGNKQQESAVSIIMPEGEDVEIVLTQNGYEPSDITIKKGTSVTFSTTAGRQHWPASNLHPAHEQYPEFDPRRPVEADESWSFTFQQPGRWELHDHIRSYYNGTIIVVE